MTNSSIDKIEQIAATSAPLFDIDAIFDQFDQEVDYPFDTEEEIAINQREIDSEQAWLERREGVQIDEDHDDDPDGGGDDEPFVFGPPTIEAYIAALTSEFETEMARVSDWIDANPEQADTASSCLLDCLDQERRDAIEWLDCRRIRG